MSKIKSFDLKFAQKRIPSTLFITQSLFSASAILLFTLTPIISAELSGSTVNAGLPNTVGLIGRAIFAYPFGYLMDRLGRRIAISGGYLALVFGALLSAWAVLNNSYPGFLAGAFFIGLSRTAADQSRFVAAEVFPASGRAKAIGLVVFAGTFGSIVGPLMVEPSGLILQRYGLSEQSGPFVVAALFMVFASAIVFLFLKPEPRDVGLEIARIDAAANPDSVENEAGKRPLTQIFAAPQVLLALLGMTLGYFVMSFLMVITPVHMSGHNHTIRAISGVIMAHTMGMFGFSWFTGWLIDRYGQTLIIKVGAGILMLSCILAPLSLRVPILGLALFLLGLGWNFAYVGGSSLLSNALSATERARAQGVSGAIVALAAGSASFTVGYVFDQGDYLWVSIGGFVIAAGLLTAVTILEKTTK